MGKVLCIDEIKRHVTNVAKNYPVERVILFGSYANGTQTAKSDIDLLVTFEKKPKEPVTLFTVIGLQQDIEKLTGRGVDVVKYPISIESFLEIDKEVLLYAKCWQNYFNQNSGDLQVFMWREEF